MKKITRVLSLALFASLSLAACQPTTTSSIPESSDPSISSPDSSAPSSSSTVVRKTIPAKTYYEDFLKAYEATQKASDFAFDLTAPSFAFSTNGSFTLTPKEEETTTIAPTYRALEVDSSNSGDDSAPISSSEDNGDNTSSSSSEEVPDVTYDVPYGTITYKGKLSEDNLSKSYAGEGIQSEDPNDYKFSYFSSADNAEYSISVKAKENGSTDTMTLFDRRSEDPFSYKYALYREDSTLFVDFSDVSMMSMINDLKSSTTNMALLSLLFTDPSAISAYMKFGPLASGPILLDDLPDSFKDTISTYAEDYENLNESIKKALSFKSIDGVDVMSITISSTVLRLLPTLYNTLALDQLSQDYPDQTSQDYIDGQKQIETTTKILNTLVRQTTINTFNISLSLTQAGFVSFGLDIDISIADFDVTDTVSIPTTFDGTTGEVKETSDATYDFKLDSFTLKTNETIHFSYDTGKVKDKPNKTYKKITINTDTIDSLLSDLDGGMVIRP